MSETEPLYIYENREQKQFLNENGILLVELSTYDQRVVSGNAEEVAKFFQGLSESKSNISKIICGEQEVPNVSDKVEFVRQKIKWWEKECEKNGYKKPGQQQKKSRSL